VVPEPAADLAERPTRVRRALAQPHDGSPTSVVGTGHCAVCGEVPVELHLEARTDRIPQVYRITDEEHATCWDLWRCKQCGLIFSDWRLTHAELESLYRRMQDQLYDSEDRCRRLTFRRGLELIERHRRRFPEGADDGAAGGRSKLLDVGCATGIFLDEAAARGWDIAGVDLSHWAVQQARRRGLSRVYECDLYSLPEPGSFDCVTMLDYIEHDPHPGRLVERVAQLLRPGGLLYITSPDIGGLAARLLGSRWWGINPLHLYYFSRQCISRLLEQHGFEVVVARSYTRVFTLGYWASRLEHFHPVMGRGGSALFRMLGLAGIRVPLNLGDMMEVLARRQG
jgi:2-polyprenyl-3-methyl-5-hydroxy-6-metoxy-1,4-benzoquinol methylase